MTLTEFTLSRRVTVIMIVLGIVLLGLIAITRIPQQLFPPITFPQLTIITEYTNAAPEEIETLITKPIEEVLGSISGLRKMVSVSREGKSMINISFSWGTDIDFAALACREKIDLVKEKLPKEAGDPQVVKFDPLARPIMIISVTGPISVSDLKLVAEKTLKDNLEKVEGVASAGLSGGLDREILIDVDQGRLQAARLSLLGISDQLEKTNLSYPAGSIKKGLYEYLIRTIGEYKKIDEIPFTVAGMEQKSLAHHKQVGGFIERTSKFNPRDTVEMIRELPDKKTAKRRLIYFKDITDVKDTFKEVTSISRFNSMPNISISIQKQADANTIRTCQKVKEGLNLLQDELRVQKVNAQIIYDGSIFIKSAIQDVVDNAWQGGLLGFFVLLFVLRNFLSAFVVVLVIPVTVMGVFFLMFIRGITFNMMSLAGVALGISMVIDNGIVIIENIFRLRQEGKNPHDATVEGTEEFMWPIISSSLTSIAVYFPIIIFVPGVAGQIFKDLSWTVIFSLIVAIFAALFIVPLFAVHMKLKGSLATKEGAGKSNPLMQKIKHFTEYLMAQKESVQNRILLAILGTAFALFMLGLFIMGHLDQTVIPKIDQGQFLIKVDMPIGTNIDGTNEVASKIEQIISKNPLVESVATSIGSSKGGESGESGGETLRASQAQILVSLKKKRNKTSDEVIQEIRSEVQKSDMEDANVEFQAGASEFAFAAGGAKPIIIEIKGYDFKVLEDLADKVKHILKDTEGVVGIIDDLGKPSPEMKINIDKKRAALYGISAKDISLTAKAAVEGLTPTKYKEEGREYDIRVRLKEADRNNIEALNNLLVKSNTMDAMVPVKEVATIEVGYGPSEISHKDQQRTVVVSADLVKGVNRHQVLSSIEQQLAEMKLEEGYTVAPGGEAKEMQESFQKIVFAFILSITLIYMIMAAQFESFIQPLIIMFTVPLCLFGVATALAITGKSISIIVLLGIVMLSGVVVNNGIVLIEYINALRSQGMPPLEAAIKAALIRTRPILMSHATSIIGLIPMAIGFGEGGELRAPLAITVMGGQASSTMFSLFVVPSLYVLVSRLTDHFFGGYELVDEEAVPEEPGKLNNAVIAKPEGKK